MRGRARQCTSEECESHGYDHQPATIENPCTATGLGGWKSLPATPLATLRVQSMAAILIVIKFGQRQGCSLRRVGQHWRVRWSCWRGRRRLLGRVSWSWRRVWDCHARPKSRRQAGVRTERRDGSKDQGCCRRGGKRFIHFSTFRTPDGKNCRVKLNLTRIRR